EGVHYYAMQFIRGQGLDAVLREVLDLRKQTATSSTGQQPPASIAHSLLTADFRVAEAAAPRAEPRAGSADRSEATGAPEARYFRSVAGLAVQAAEGLHYAHQQGVLHRDVKPSNLLLDLYGTLWLTDFGLAKADDGDALTEAGDILGTLRYMAPE